MTHNPPDKNARNRAAQDAANPPMVVVAPPAPRPEDSRRPVPERAGHSCRCPEEAEQWVWMRGKDGRMHEAAFCGLCGKVTFDDPETQARASRGEDVFGMRDSWKHGDHAEAELTKSFAEHGGEDLLIPGYHDMSPLERDAARFALGLTLKSVYWHEALLKAAPSEDGPSSGSGNSGNSGNSGGSGRHIDNPEAHGLRWITVHPNGDDSKGQPILVHDNGESYTVVGGAGGKLNQLVLKKPTGKDKEKIEARKAARKAAREKENAARRALMTEDERDVQAKIDDKRQQAAGIKRQMHEAIAEEYGLAFSEEAEKAYREEASRRARAEKRDATQQEVDQVADQAVKQAKKEHKKAVDTVVNTTLERMAKDNLGSPDLPEEAVVKLPTPDGGTETRRIKLTDDQFREIGSALAQAKKLQAEARALEQVLSGGNEQEVAGIAAGIKDYAPSDREVQDLITKGYLDDQGVAVQTRLIHEAEGHGDVKGPAESVQRRNQSYGAADGINNYVSAGTGKAILSPEMVRQLGPENAARVAAAYLRNNGVVAKEAADELMNRIATKSNAQAAAAFRLCEELDRMAGDAEAAALNGDGTVSKVQARIMKAQASSEKGRILNVAKGQLRGAAALAWHLTHPDKTPMAIDGGQNEIGAYRKAVKDLGLSDDQFTIERGGKGYEIRVAPEHIHALAQEHTVAQHEANMAMAALQQDVENNPGQWQSKGFDHDRFSLQPHQELAARAIVQQKKMVLNYGAGSGKTPTTYAAVGHLLQTGAIDHALITMPAKPRAQQLDYVDTAGDRKEGEVRFLAPELRDKVRVVAGKAQMEAAIADVKAGRASVIITSPESMRDNLQALKDAGFGGQRSAYFADEVHDVMGDGGSGEAAYTKAVKEMLGAEYAVGMSGTLLKKGAEDVFQVVDAISPGALGQQKAFASEWQRLSRNQEGVFGEDALTSLRARLSGMMVTYHKPVERPTADGGSEAVELIKDGKTLAGATGAAAKGVYEVQLSEEEKGQIAQANAQYEKDRLSENEKTRKSAAFTRERAIKNVVNNSPAKHKAISDRIRENMAANPDHHTLIHCSETRPLGALKKHLAEQFPGVGIVQVTGKENDRAVAAAMKKFNTPGGKHKIMLITDAGNYGLNATAADDIIKNQTPPTRAIDRQIEGRGWRIGRVDDVHTTTVRASGVAQEQLQHYRVHHVQAPQMDLLTRVAMGGGSELIPHIPDLEEAAGRRLGEPAGEGPEGLQKGFNPDEPRDDRGRWTDEEGRGLSAHTVKRDLPDVSHIPEKVLSAFVAYQDYAEARIGDERFTDARPGHKGAATRKFYKLLDALEEAGLSENEIPRLVDWHHQGGHLQKAWAPAGEPIQSAGQLPAGTYQRMEEQAQPAHPQAAFPSHAELDKRMEALEGRAAEEYDEAIRGLKADHELMDHRAGAHERTQEGLQSLVDALMDGHVGLDPETAEKALQYLEAGMKAHDARVARRLAFPATAPGEGHELGKPLGGPAGPVEAQRWPAEEEFMPRRGRTPQGQTDREGED